MSDRSGNSMLRRFFGSRKNHEPLQQEETEEYVEEITERLTEEGYINPEEAGMIMRVVELRDRTAAEIMVPRTEIFAIGTDEPLDQVIERIRKRGHSRIPVFDGTIDNIIGVLYTKDLLKLWGRPTMGPKDHLALLRPPTIIPEGKPATELLAKFKADRVHIAIVIDEYGNTSGLVTLEDVLEEIFGEIQDEYDESEVALVTDLPDGTVLVDARLPFERAVELFDFPEPEDDRDRDYDTLGGFLSQLTGHIPRRGETLEIAGWSLQVESANSRRIFKIRMNRKTQAEDETTASYSERPGQERPSFE